MGFVLFLVTFIPFAVAVLLLGLLIDNLRFRAAVKRLVGEWRRAGYIDETTGRLLTDYEREERIRSRAIRDRLTTVTGEQKQASDRLAQAERRKAKLEEENKRWLQEVPAAEAEQIVPDLIREYECACEEVGQARITLETATRSRAHLETWLQEHDP